MMYNLPSQSMVILYIHFSAFLRCSVCYRPTYSIPKSPNTNIKLIIQVMWNHNPAVMGAGKYFYSASLFWRWSWAMQPSYGSPYIHLQISMYMYPLCTNG